MVNRIWHYHFGRGIVGHAGRFRAHGRAADASRTAGLPGRDLRRERLEHQEDAPHDPAVQHLSAVVGFPGQRGRGRSRQQAAVALSAASPGSRGDSRFHAVRQRPAESARWAARACSRRFLAGTLSDLSATAAAGGWKTEKDAAQNNRRSVYIFVRRNLRYPMLQEFDSANTFESCDFRKTTVTPSQSLDLLNNDLVLEWARVLRRPRAERQRPDSGRAGASGPSSWLTDVRRARKSRRLRRISWPSRCRFMQQRLAGWRQSQAAAANEHAGWYGSGAGRCVGGLCRRCCSIPTSFCTSIKEDAMADPMLDPMLNKLKHHWNVSTRREFFTQAGSGLAGIALAAMLARTDTPRAAPILWRPRSRMCRRRAKNIIWCFMEGGPSQVDLFDPKPMLDKLALQPVPPSFHPETLLTAQGAKPSDGLFPARRAFKQYGQSGLWVSDWLPNIAQHVDDMAVIRSCYIRRRQSRRRRVRDEHRLDSGRTAVAGSVGDLRPGQRAAESADVRRHAGRQGDPRRRCRTTAPASCPRPIRARCSARAIRPSSI